MNIISKKKFIKVTLLVTILITLNTNFSFGQKVTKLSTPIKAKSVNNWFIYKDFELEERLMPTSEDDLIIIGYQAWVFQVKKNDTIGFISLKGIQRNSVTTPLIEMVAEKSNKLEEEEIARKQMEGLQLQFEKEGQDLIKKFGRTIGFKIFLHSYWIGMTKEMAELSLGAPDKINRTVTSTTQNEQWVYEKYDIYLYFKNGILESFQDTR